jgi:cytochrome c oxidase assembly factor CtaG
MIFAITHILFATLTIGSLIALVFLLPEREGRLENQSRIRRFLPIFAGVWFLSALGQLISTLAALFDTNLVNVFDLTMIRSYVTQTSLGRLQFAELAAAGAVFIFQGMLRKVGGAFWLLLIALMGIIAPVFQSHSSNLGSHGLATGSLVVHVAAIVSWVGAVSAFAMMEERYREIARPRVAITASWSAIAIALSGMANAWTRLRLSSEWLSSYGAILITKITLYLAVLLIARKLRAKVATSKLLYFEVSLLIIIISLGSILNRFVPIKDAISVDRSQELIGIAMPPAPTWTNVSLAYEADGLIIGVLVFATALYIKGVLTLSRRGISWPKGRTLSFAIGIALIDFATSGGVGLYSHFSFGFHMIAHMILSMIAPIALVLSAPITLALRALPIGRTSEERGLKGLLVSILHSKGARLWTHPIVALAIFDGSLFALYFTPLFGKLMSSHFGHLVMDVHFIGAGLLFFHVIVGIDPNPRKVHHLARVVMLLAAMSIHSFFSVSLMSSNSLIDDGYFQSLARPWATDLLSDQKLGASIGWAMGEIPIVVALIATFIQWVRSDARDAKRADRRSESELAEYNAYLAKLAEQKEK